MILFDIHAHLTHPKFKDDLPQVLEKSKKEGVTLVIANGVNPDDNREVLQLAEKYDIVKAALGFYPTDALGIPEPGKEAKEWDFDAELEFIRSQKDKIVGLGEVGMDFKVIKELDLQKKQREMFQKFIELSESMKKPLIIHSRGAEREIIEMLESSNVKKANLHMFGGRKSLVRRANDMGLHVSVPPVCVRLEHFKMIVKEMSINQLLTETDAPWLGHIAGERNLPENVRESVKFIAEIKGFDPIEVSNNLWLNYQNLFS